jgi:uroporphyrin-III C-methyltransferase
MPYTPGTVYLIGAGPGDPELITVRGLRILQAADVVLHDRLIPAELLDEARTDAEIIDVSKYPGFQRFTQYEINELLVDRAVRGLAVARLKGGDPFVFGRGAEEIIACQAAGVPVVVVPGVTSATAVPAAAGVPVTHRGVGRSFAVITAETDPELGESPIPYEALATLDTVIVLMGLRRLPDIAQGLLAAGRDPETPAVCIEAGWTNHQVTVADTLAGLADSVAAARLRPPVTIVIGDVAAFANDRAMQDFYPKVAWARRRSDSSR